MLGMSEADRATFERYERIVRQFLADGVVFAATREMAGAVQVERGLVLAMAVGGRDPTGLRATAGRLVDARDVADVVVIDAAGHRRPAYRGLLLHAWRRAASLERGRGGTSRLSAAERSTWDAALARWSRALADEAARADWLVDGEVPARLGGAAAGSVWAALARMPDSGGPPTSTCVARLTGAQRASGAFLSGDASDNPETRWYHELVLLHACATYAIISGDPAAARAVARAAEYHVAETQPDHATSQPWGLPAFIWSGAARPLADEMLHAVRVRQAEGADGVSQVLLADTLLGVRALIYAAARS